MQYSQALVKDAVVLFREAVVRYHKDPKNNGGYKPENRKKCRNNDKEVYFRPGKAFMDILRKVSCFLYICFNQKR